MLPVRKLKARSSPFSPLPRELPVSPSCIERLGELSWTRLRPQRFKTSDLSLRGTVAALYPR